MITILTGNPGHGKSYTSIRMIDGFVHQGKLVVTNVPLREDFAEQMARHHTPFSRWRQDTVKKKAEKIRSRVHVCRDTVIGVDDNGDDIIESAMDQILRVRFDGKGEGRAKVVIDEAHRDMNVRGSSRGKSTEAQKRKTIVNYASAHRHYGADLIIISQAIANVDVQVRNLHEFHSEVRNFRKLPVLGLFARLIPGGQLFLRVTVWSDRQKTKAGIEMYGLSKRLACLYDTHGLVESDWPDDAIVLPKPLDSGVKEAEVIPITGKSEVPVPDLKLIPITEKSEVPVPDFTVES